MMSNDMLDRLYQRALMRRKDCLCLQYQLDVYTLQTWHSPASSPSVDSDWVKVCLSSATFMTDYPSYTYGKTSQCPTIRKDITTTRAEVRAIASMASPIIGHSSIWGNFWIWGIMIKLLVSMCPVSGHNIWTIISKCVSNNVLGS